jgi:hypothetical protein
MNVWAPRTAVPVQSPTSKSHERTVQSHPELNALPSSSRENKAFDTRPVCDLRTVLGALRFGGWSSVRAEEVASFRRFLVGSSPDTGTGTSSSSGIFEVQSPMRWSQLAVSRCVPEPLALIEETEAVCKCNETRPRAVPPSIEEILAVVS